MYNLFPDIPHPHPASISESQFENHFMNNILMTSVYYEHVEIV